MPAKKRKAKRVARKKPAKKRKVNKVKNAAKLKRALKDSLADFAHFKVEAKRPRRSRAFDDDGGWSGNIYRYSF